MKKRQLVGILNCTPDSYFEGGRFTDPGLAIEYALRLFEEGADVIDIGGESTRPGSASYVDEEEEMRRVLPVIEGIRRHTSLPLSIDTYKPKVAEAALHAGASWINDITGFSHPDMQRLACEWQVHVCVMHMAGSPHSTSTSHYPLGVVEEIIAFFQQRVAALIDRGISPSQIILDPGIGGGAFGKTPENCLEILTRLPEFCQLGFPLLIGLSRKSFLQIILQKPPSEVLSTTLALNTIALEKGVTYIRVHDVAAHKDILTLLSRLDAIN